MTVRGRRPTSPAALARQCEAFNKAYPPGTAMLAWKGPMLLGEGHPGTVRRPGAYVLSGHTAVVMLDGVSGCIALTHVTPAAPQAPGRVVVDHHG